MKYLKKIILVAVAIVAASTVFAQEDGNNCETTKFMQNNFWDNTYLGVAGGVNTLVAKGGQAKITPDIEAYFGKWFAPGFGTRVSYQGFKLRENYPGDFRHHYSPEGTEGVTGMKSVKYGFAYFHADAMWNMVNAFSKTKNHAVTVAPYWHVGLVHLYEITENFFTTECQDNEFGMGPGLYLGFRLGKRLDLTVDVRDIFYSGRFHNWNNGGAVQTLSAAAGLAVKFGKTDWDKGVNSACYDDAMAALDAARAALDAANASLLAAKAENDALNTRIGVLNYELDSLRNLKNAVVVENDLGIAPLVVYYEFDKDKLSKTEIQHLNDYVQYILSKDANFTFYLTGSADKGTGSYNYNMKLAQRRANGIKDILMKSFGVSNDNIIVNEGKVSADHPDQPKLDRYVTVSK